MGHEASKCRVGSVPVGLHPADLQPVGATRHHAAHLVAVIPNDAARLGGVLALLAQLAFGWGKFGFALNGTFVQDGVSYFFKLLFLLAAFF